MHTTENQIPITTRVAEDEPEHSKNIKIPTHHDKPRDRLGVDCGTRHRDCASRSEAGQHRDLETQIALLGCRAGDTIFLSVLDANYRTKIEEVIYQPEPDGNISMDYTA